MTTTAARVVGSRMAKKKVNGKGMMDNVSGEVSIVSRWAFKSSTYYAKLAKGTLE